MSFLGESQELETWMHLLLDLLTISVRHPQSRYFWRSLLLLLLFLLPELEHKCSSAQRLRWHICPYIKRITHLATAVQRCTPTNKQLNTHTHKQLQPHYRKHISSHALYRSAIPSSCLLPPNSILILWCSPFYLPINMTYSYSHIYCMPTAWLVYLNSITKRSCFKN